MTTEESKIRELTDAFISRLVTIEKELIAFQQQYELSDLFIDTVHQIAVDEFKLEKNIR